eukprot:c8533_g1_i1.p1 GENE.c8533_g1_i1~~c8533_g1_i1.p1  ORF type:complete len:448 (+),score=84.55 c8533_g1_i1:72-1346(+)
MNNNAIPLGALQVSQVATEQHGLPAISDLERKEWLTTHLFGQKPDFDVLGKSTQTTPGVIEAAQFAEANPNQKPVNCGKTENAFIFTVWKAYCSHYPLVLSPDDIWLVIIQGFSRHVKANSESLRGSFVTHSGKEQIIVDGYKRNIIPRHPNNDWPGVVSDFEQALQVAITGDSAKTITDPFSTTGPIQAMAFRVALMDSMQNYFEYICRLRCGLPYIQLLGKVEDWVQLRERASRLEEYNLGWWTEHLLPLLDIFVRTAQHSANVKRKALSQVRTRNDNVPLDQEATTLGAFWSRICDFSGSGSGPRYISGWLNILFPYSNRGDSRAAEFAACQANIQDLVSLDSSSPKPNPQLSSRLLEHNSTILRTEIGRFPSGFSKSPFVLDKQGVLIPMEMVAGFMGALQEKDSMALSPLMGWCCVRPN